jgi:hypothetical protein
VRIVYSRGPMQGQKGHHWFLYANWSDDEPVRSGWIPGMIRHAQKEAAYEMARWLERHKPIDTTCTQVAR